MLGAVIDLLRIRADLDRGQRALADLSLKTIDDQGGIARVAGGASRDLTHAEYLARTSPFLKVLTPLPVLGDQVRGLRDLTAAARQLGDLGRSAADRVQQALDAAKQSPHARVALIDTVIAALTDVKAGLGRVDVGARGSLLAPLSSARAQLVRRISAQGPKIDDAIRLSRAMRSFLAGPSKYLVLGGNNAEMRSLGIATTSGVAMISDGSVNVSDFYDVDVVNISEAVPAPQELVDLYGWLNIQYGYENSVTTPNFPAAAQISSAVSDRNVVGPVDGVIYTDTVTLQALLGVVGPVTVDGVTYDGTNAASELINRNYLRYQTGVDAPERRKSQSNAAKAIFEALNTRSYSITKLASVLSDLAKSRHLLAWAKDPAVNELWQKVGADGATTPDTFAIAAQELGASKLDFYTRLGAALRVERTSAGWRVKVDVTIDNPKKDNSKLSPYILGGDIYVKPGDYGFFLALSIPKSATDLVHPDPLAKSGTDGPLQVMAIADSAPNGERRTEHFEFTLPASQRVLRILPSARLNPIDYTVGGRSFNDVFPQTVDLAAAAAASAAGAQRPAPSRLPATLGALAMLLADLMFLNVLRRRFGPFSTH